MRQKISALYQSVSQSRFYTLGLIAAIALIAFTVLRTGLYIWSFNELSSPILSLPYIYASGAIYDLTFILYFLTPCALFLTVIPQKIYERPFFKYIIYAGYSLILFGLLFVLVAECLFWEEFSVRFNFISVDYLIYRREVTDNINESYPMPLILSVLVLLTASIVFATRHHLRKAIVSVDRCKQRAVVAASFLLACILLAFGLNQSLRDLSDNNYCKELASSGPYQFVAAFRNNTMDYKMFFQQGDDKELSNLLKQICHKENTNPDDLYNIQRTVTNTNTRKNVILVSIESLSAEFLKRFGGTHGDITPCMDQLFTEGLLFTDFYATGTRTTRGLEAITLSLPPTPGRSVVKRPKNGNFYNIGKVYKDNGYDVAYLYGGRGYFDNMNAFFSGNGYRIIDQYSTPDEEMEFTNAWGMCDEDLYKQTIKEASRIHTEGKPFFFHVMTTSNHRPYTYPEDRIDIPSGTNRSGAVKYSDYAIQQLIDNARDKAWFDDTLFVIVADHCASSAGRVGLPTNKYHIPLFIYAPKHVPSKEISKRSSQIDIAPTLLALCGISYDSWFFGDNILSDKFEERALIGNYQKVALYEGDDLTIISSNKSVQVIHKPTTGGTQIEDADLDAHATKKTMAYYQGADYILENKRNRWSDQK